MNKSFYVKVTLVCCFSLVALFLAGCQPAPPASDVESGAKKVVTFDGGSIAEGEVVDEVQRQGAAFAARSGQSAPNITPGSPQFDAAKAQVMPQLLSASVAEAYARENGIEVSGDEIQSEIDRVKGDFARQAQSAGQTGDTEELFQGALKNFGFTDASFREEVRRSLLVQKVQDAVAGDASPSEEEVQSFYEQNKDSPQITPPEQRCIRHILFTENQQDQAQKVKDQLDNGADFAELAKEYSQDPQSSEKGGDLGCQPKGHFVKEFDDAAFSAKEGEIVGPVKTDFGYHLIQVTKIQPQEQKPLEEVRPDIEKQLKQQQQAATFQDWVQSQVKERNVRYLPGYNPQEETTLPNSPQSGTPESTTPEEEVPPEQTTGQ